ncbi:hypothetical protein Asp14428_56960 [Actinoplanes sp. NBRC 14428]|nr:hypothetical protein Asp14428_56960 [Actinoplanes sp. NBRC 14428]
MLEPVALGIGTVAADIPGVRFIDEHLPGVTIVHTDAEPDVWAAAVLRAARHTAATNQSDAVHNFTRSVFAIDEAVRKHLAIYQRRNDSMPTRTARDSFMERSNGPEGTAR